MELIWQQVEMMASLKCGQRRIAFALLLLLNILAKLQHFNLFQKKEMPSSQQV
jgi:hypothetical protein